MFIKDKMDIFYDDKCIILAQQLHHEKVLVVVWGQTLFYYHFIPLGLNEMQLVWQVWY